MKSKSLLMGASALVAVAMAGGAHAQTEIYGGGSTLIGPYLSQAENCYGQQSAYVVQGGWSPSTNVAPNSGYVSGNEAFDLVPGFNFTSTPLRNCATAAPLNSAIQFNYIGSGSGNGELGLFTKDEANTEGTTTNGGPEQHAFPAGSIQYGAGDYGVGQADVLIYNNGNEGGSPTFSGKFGDGSTHPVFLSPTDTTTIPSGVTYANPLVSFGNFIQFPISIDPVAVAYSPQYEQIINSDGSTGPAYSFHINKPTKVGTTVNGGLLLDVQTVCAIFNGKITNWNDPVLKALNGGKSLEDPTDPTPAASWSVPIELVARSDSSGTTSIAFRALAAQCQPGDAGGNVSYTETADKQAIPVTYDNQFVLGGSNNGKTMPPGLLSSPLQTYVLGTSNNFGSGITPQAGKFTVAKGSDAVAQYVSFPAASTLPAGSTWVQGRITFIGTDYVIPYSTNNGLPENLFSADIALTTGAATGIQPTPANALKAFGTSTGALLPPQSNATGLYEDGSSGHIPLANGHGTRANSWDWAEPIAVNTTYLNDPANGGSTDTVPTPLANPNNNGVTNATKAYPFVGTTQAFLNTCYASSSVVSGLTGFFTFYEGKNTVAKTLVTNATKGLLAEAGLSPLPVAWQTAILQTFITPTATKGTTLGTNVLNLNILPSGTAGSGGIGAQCAGIAAGTGA